MRGAEVIYLRLHYFLVLPSYDVKVEWVYAALFVHYCFFGLGSTSWMRTTSDIGEPNLYNNKYN